MKNQGGGKIINISSVNVKYGGSAKSMHYVASKAALESLPEQFRIAVILCDIEEFSYKEIAEILDVPIGTVMSRIHRGRKLLQKRLWDYAAEHRLLPDDAVSVASGTPVEAGAG